MFQKLALSALAPALWHNRLAQMSTSQRYGVGWCFASLTRHLDASSCPPPLVFVVSGWQRTGSNKAAGAFR
eukprot:11785379-Alexandrium_andersonii.AAC.1